MLDTSTCFSFAGSEKEDLGKLGHWLYQQVAEMHASQQLLLARSHGSGSYTKILELVSRLTDRGERLVIFENEAFRIVGIIDHVLNATDTPRDSDIAKLALPFFRDIGEFYTLARMEYRNAMGLKPYVRRCA